MNLWCASKIIFFFRKPTKFEIVKYFFSFWQVPKQSPLVATISSKIPPKSCDLPTPRCCRGLYRNPGQHHGVGVPHRRVRHWWSGPCGWRGSPGIVTTKGPPQMQPTGDQGPVKETGRFSGQIFIVPLFLIINFIVGASKIVTKRVSHEGVKSSFQKAVSQMAAKTPFPPDLGGGRRWVMGQLRS